MLLFHCHVVTSPYSAHAGCETLVQHSLKQSSFCSTIIKCSFYGMWLQGMNDIDTVMKSQVPTAHTQLVHSMPVV